MYVARVDIFSSDINFIKKLDFLGNYREDTTLEEPIYSYDGVKISLEQVENIVKAYRKDHDFEIRNFEDGKPLYFNPKV